MPAGRGDERAGKDVGDGGEEGRVAERGGGMGRMDEKTRSDRKMGSSVEREGQGQTGEPMQTETWGQTEELVGIGRNFYMPCRHMNSGKRTL